MAKSKILVIEDERKIAEIVRIYLNSAGYQVSVASDGISGLAQTETFSPGLIILDLMLPEWCNSQVRSSKNKRTLVPQIGNNREIHRSYPN